MSVVESILFELEGVEVKIEVESEVEVTVGRCWWGRGLLAEAHWDFR